MHYHFKIYKEKSGFWAECLELRGCQTQADSMDELRENMFEALNLYLSEPSDSKLIFPLPLKKIPKGREISKVEVNPSVAFAFFLRKIRLEKKLTLKEMAEKLNYKNINTYVKLEKAQTANPGLKTLSNIKKTFMDFPINLILLN